MVSKSEYLEQIAATRDERMQWWREARFGMFVHFGLYSQIGRNEWVQACENIPVPEYEHLADTFCPKEGCCREWADAGTAPEYVLPPGQTPRVLPARYPGPSGSPGCRRSLHWCDAW